MTSAREMARKYQSRRYRLEQDGRRIEEVVVPVDSYEDTRLGLEALDPASGWKVVEAELEAELEAEPPAGAEPAEEVSDANDTSSPAPAEQPAEDFAEQPVEHDTEGSE